MSIATLRLDTPYPIPAESRFVDEDGAKVDFLADNEATSILERLRRQHERFAKLADIKIDVLWKRTGGKSGGRLILGKCTKPSGAFKHLTHLDFLILLGADNCEANQLTEVQVEALIFHELCHADIDGHGKPRTVAHDFELFAAELVEYGTWKRDLQALGDVFQQLELW